MSAPQIYPAKPEDRTEWPFRSGHISNGADKLRELVDGAGRAMFFTWNGTPFDGYPGDTPVVIIERWHAARLELQAANKPKPWKPRELPGIWTDLTEGMTRQQAENLLDALGQHSKVTVYRDGKPVAVLLSIEEYRKASS